MSCRFHSRRRRMSRRGQARDRACRRRASSSAAGFGSSVLCRLFDAFPYLAGLEAAVEEAFGHLPQGSDLFVAELEENVLFRVPLAGSCSNRALVLDCRRDRLLGNGGGGGALFRGLIERGGRVPRGGQLLEGSRHGLP